MTCGESNRHVKRWRNVTPKGQVVTPMHFESNAAKTAGDDFSNNQWKILASTDGFSLYEIRIFGCHKING